jgi:hypothetical protein
MIESHLTGLLERAGERTTVGPAPIELMHARVTRRRRRRALVSVTAAVAAVAAVGGTALALRPGASPEVSPPPVASASPGVVPADMRLVGLGHAAIAAGPSALSDVPS